MSYTQPITGSIVALVTPMHADSSLDLESLASLVKWHIEQQSAALVVAGTTGEAATLSVAEHCQVINTAVKAANGKIPIIAGTGANSTTEAMTLTQAAADAGADAALLITPYYNKPSQEGLYRHHELIASTVAIPQILYNVPSRTAVDLLPSTIARLALIDNIVGVKEATGDISRAIDIKNRVESANIKNFAIYSGDDATAVKFILAGMQGGISVTANIIPSTISKIYQLALSNQADKAHELDATIASLHKNLFIQSNPVPIKWAMHKAALIKEGIRLPLLPLETQYWQILADELTKLELV